MPGRHKLPILVVLEFQLCFGAGRYLPPDYFRLLLNIRLKRIHYVKIFKRDNVLETIFENYSRLFLPSYFSGRRIVLERRLHHLLNLRVTFIHDYRTFRHTFDCRVHEFLCAILGVQRILVEVFEKVRDLLVGHAALFIYCDDVRFHRRLRDFRKIADDCIAREVQEDI